MHLSILVLKPGDVGFEKVRDGSRSLLLGGRVESNALDACIDAARARGDFSITLGQSVKAAEIQGNCDMYR